MFFGRGVKELINISPPLPVYEIQKEKKSAFLTRFVRYVSLLRSPILLVNQVFTRFCGNHIFWILKEFSGQIMELRALIRKEMIALFILPADNRYDQAAYVKAAHLENIGVVVVPQFMAGPLEWAEYVWGQSPYQVKRMINKLALALYPRWGLEYKGRRLLALPGANVFALEWLGIAPPLPWVLHSGSSDVLALESEAVYDYCIGEGIPSSQVKITGSIAHDILFDVMTKKPQKKDELLQSLGIENNLPIILSALPPDSLYMNRPECDFKSYSDLVEFWCKSIALVPGYNHLVSLHPSLKYEQMKYIEKFGLKIVREPTANIVPLADIYVASISSTIQWAIACGIPVVNYDVYRYRYSDYSSIAGVVATEEKTEFIDLILKLTNDPDYYSKIALSQKDVSHKWGVLDGLAGSRLENLFTTIILNYKTEN